MAAGSAKPFGEHLQTLWGVGTCAGLSDRELLARFLAVRDEAGELAFEVLVKRHGPMVERVCHQVLDDPGDVHDAWQGVFLVLARRASSIRSCGSIAGWLHGVAIRVAKRTRVTAIRHRVRARRTNESAERHALHTQRARDESSCRIEQEELAAVVHHEISRLPEKYRTPIVLCYLEGLTHDEAAGCLKRPVGTVRSRLSRGRDALRRRLSRHGLAAPAALGPLGAWLAGDEAVAAITGGALAACQATGIPTSAASRIVKLAYRITVDPTSADTPIGATSLALAEGVLKMMTLKKLSVTAAALLSFAAISIGGAALVRATSGQSPQARPFSSEAKKFPEPGNSVKTAHADAVNPRVLKMLDIARRRFETMLRRFNEGEISVTQLIEAADQLERLDLRAASDRAARTAAAERSLRRFEGIVTFEQRSFDAGNASAPDLDLAQLRLMQAVLELETPDDQKIDNIALLRRLKELEKKVQQLEKRVPAGLGGSM
jgi:RNA polymerase sigma factor (sigma-70 family)